MKTPTEDISEPLWSHIEELRSVLIRALAVIVLGSALALWFYQPVFAAITWPLQYTQSPTPAAPLQKQEVKTERVHNTAHEAVKFELPQNARLVHAGGESKEIAPGIFLIGAGESLDIQTITAQEKLVIFGPADGMITTIKVCFWLGLIGTAPIWLYFVLQFVTPALRHHEKRLLGPFLALSAAFLTGGLLFAFFITLPLSSAFLWAFNAELGINLWSLSNYLDFTLFLLLANALAFEISLVLFFMVHLGAITPIWMVQHRRHMIIAALVIAALLTPPDVPSQLMLAIPLIALYEAAILYARFINNARRTSGTG